MEKIQRILVATDFSSRADRAVQRAVQLAAEHEAKLNLLHVLPVFSLETFKHLISETPLETEQRLYNHAKAVLQNKSEVLAGDGVAVEHHVAIGRAHVEINRYAKSHYADLVVIGDQGETFVKELFLGTTASKTLSRGNLPLLIVKQEPKGQYKHVLVPVDFSRSSLEALDVALKVVTGSSIHVLHAIEMPLGRKMKQVGLNAKSIDLYRDKMLSRAREAMEKLVGDHVRGDTRVTCVIEYGGAPAVIAEKTKLLDIDLIVMGKRGETELDEVLFGSVTKHVLYETPCDVLVVNPVVASPSSP